jgi:histidinol-phosphate phosphatase family protein
VRPAVFVDRDGTLVEDVGYCCRPEDLRLLPGAAPAVALLNRAGLPVVVVTNQSAVARGYLSPQGLDAIHARLREVLAAGGAHLDAIYVCPHHPRDGCPCRKPKPGLLHRAAADLGLDLARSYVVGDRAADVEVARAVGAAAVLVETGPPEAQAEVLAAGPPDHRRSGGSSGSAGAGGPRVPHAPRRPAVRCAGPEPLLGSNATGRSAAW